MKIMTRITPTIKTLLKRKRKKQKELADFLGLSESGLSHLMAKGRYTHDQLEQIGKYLGVDLITDNITQIKYLESFGQKTDDDCESRIKLLTQLVELKDDVIKAKDALIQQLMANTPQVKKEKHNT